MGAKTPSPHMAAFIAIVFVVLFAFSYLVPVLNVPWIRPDAKFDAGLTNTMLMMLALVVGYYIGTSKSSEDKNQIIATQATTASTIANSVAAAPLGAGPTGTSADPVSVEVAPGDASAKVLGTLASLRDKT